MRPKFKGKFEQLPRVCRQLYVETRRYAITTSELVVRRSALGGIIKQLNKASMMSRERRDLLRNVRFVNDVVSDCDAECQCKRMFLRDWKRLEECLVWMKLIERVVVEVKGKPKGVSDIVLGFVREFGGCERSCVDFVPLRLNGVVVELDVL